MDFSRVGKKIQELRKYHRMTQAELAEGICTQAQVSKIENGTIIPYSNTLYQISERLGADIYYFFDEAKSSRPDYVGEVFEQLKELRFQQNYVEIREILEHEKENPLFEPSYYKQYMLWHESICSYHLDRDLKEALRLLNLAFEIDDNPTFTERKGEMMNTLAIFYDLEKNYEKAASICEKALNELHKLKRIKDVSVELRLIYTLTKALTNQQKYESSIFWCEKGIKRCIDSNNMYVFGELLYQKGRNLIFMDRIEEGIESWKKAHSVFELTNQHRLAEIVKKEWTEIEEKGTFDDLTYE
ncbi:helix-turn-helix domain-containing protein [Aliibacillus thermotolerans]|uniref:Helix-turn-helix domain-containing protein n=1 Tax=Aliibacillus thermotolerans TaxID=1834418 RepID=A0ABW0U7G7_9BACI|nr:helix-turn-helix domain-containing protein [Aliibacillus thermotolerans]MDA3129735.1 helix-turn-helix domain-containing protein [Aliibacillus thermotolerans]